MPLRSFVIVRPEAGQPLASVLSRRLHLPWPPACQLVRQRLVRIDGVPCTDPHRRVQAGQKVSLAAARSSSRQRQPRKSGAATSPGAVSTAIDPRIIRYRDNHLVVVDKPAGLTTMRHDYESAEFGARAQRFLPQTLADLLPPLLAGKRRGRRPKLRAVHRLDRDTSGLVVFALTPEAERHLGQQFRAHTVERRYLAVVRGRAQEGRIESWLVRDRGDGRRGSTSKSGTGQRAVTHVRIVEELGVFTLVECRLETGRTHQVRIHLGEAGTPLCGETIYDRPPHGRPFPDLSQSPRLALHATELGLEHPATGERMKWTSPLPDELSRLVQRLRQRG